MRTRLSILIISATLGCSPDEGVPPGGAVGWSHYGGVAGGTNYSSLAQIDPNNVGYLKVAWSLRTGDLPAWIYDPGGHRAGSRRENGAPVDPRVGAPCGTCHENQIRFEVTPVVHEGVLYLSTPFNRVLAVHPGTGESLWTYDPKIDRNKRYAESFTSRGVAVWGDTAASGFGCATRVFVTTVDARLIALDGDTGRPCIDFGANGVVDLKQGIRNIDVPAAAAHYTVTSPPAVVRNLVIVGSAINSTRRDAPSGVVRAYNARTGRLAWSFDPIKHDSLTTRIAATSEPHEAVVGGGNVWSTISVDTSRDLIFLPTASASPHHYGGDRLGPNDYATSVVALRATTGDVVWSFQVVHHDLWDYDVAAQPVLITLRRDGRSIPAVVVGTKTGSIFVLDRVTGSPVFPVEERPVPPSDVPGEIASPTQPFAKNVPSLHGTRLTPDSAFGLNQTEREYCRALLGRLRNDGLFTPPSLKGTLAWPGVWGGINWDGLAWDSASQTVVTTVKRLGMILQLHRRSEVAEILRNRPPGLQYFPQEGSRFAASRRPIVAPSGTPCTPPPWALLVAVDLNDLSVKWQRPLGVVPGLSHLPASKGWGSLAFGGPLITGSGLVFVAASQDDRFRAFDLESGALLWEHLLPAGGQATPMTYQHRGKQYVLIAAGGRSGVGSPGDWIVAFAL